MQQLLDVGILVLKLQLLAFAPLNTTIGFNLVPSAFAARQTETLAFS